MRCEAAASTTSAAAAAAADAAKRLAEFAYTAPLPGGATLVVRPLAEEWIAPCADLLTSSFVATSASLAPFAKLLRRRVAAYLEEHARLPPKALVLTAVVVGRGEERGAAEEGASIGSSSSSTNGSSGSSNGGGSSSGGAGVLVGTGEVSFDPSTRSAYVTLNPPAKCAYVCNVATAPAWRRRGVATHIMAALEAAAALAGESEAFLHLRFRDAAEAGRLYGRLGYAEAAADGWWAFLLGVDRRRLMRKALPPAAVGGNGDGSVGNGSTTTTTSSSSSSSTATT